MDPTPKINPTPKSFKGDKVEARKAKNEATLAPRIEVYRTEQVSCAPPLHRDPVPLSLTPQRPGRVAYHHLHPPIVDEKWIGRALRWRGDSGKGRRGLAQDEVGNSMH